MICYSLFTVAPAWYMGLIVDGLKAGEIPSQSKFVLVGLGLVLIFVLKGISYFGQNYLMGSVGQSFIRDLRDRLYEKIILKPLAFFNKNTTGDLISRFTIDLNTLNEAVTISITGPLRDIPQIIFLFGVMFIRSWQLTVVTFFLLPPAAYLIQKFGSQNKKVTTKRLNKYGELTALLTETIKGIRVVKAFSMENYESERFAKENNRLYKFFLSSILISSYSYPVLELTGGICAAIILPFGGYLISHGDITAGDFVSFILAFFMLNEPIKKLNGLSLKIQEGSAAAQRIFNVLGDELKIEEDPNADEMPTIQQEIRIQIGKFAYGDQPVLNNLDLTLKAGTATALVGASGSGKSTLANLIPRFYDIPREHGSIKIDGKDLRDVTLISLRKQIAIVTQEVVLFNDTIANNITYGDISCDRARIKNAAKAAYADNFIEELENGYDQEIGESGIRLSGGQRQRISISRALIKDAPILILDEATSALDTESEKEVQAAIENLMKDRTSLVIAHRLSTIQYADVIHVMKNGSVVESGSHKELLEKGGEYKRLYDMQFQDS